MFVLQLPAATGQEAASHPGMWLSECLAASAKQSPPLREAKGNYAVLVRRPLASKLKELPVCEYVSTVLDVWSEHQNQDWANPGSLFGNQEVPGVKKLL